MSSGSSSTSSRITLPSVTFTIVWPASGYPYPASRVRQGVLLVEAVEVGARKPSRLALLQRCRAYPMWPLDSANADSVRAELVDGQAVPRQLPRIDLVTALWDVSGDRLVGAGRDLVLSLLPTCTGSRSSARSSTTTSAPCCSSASAWWRPVDAHDIAEVAGSPASTPDNASSNTAASVVATPRASAPAMNESGAGLPRQLPLDDLDAVDACLDETVEPRRLEHRLAVRRGCHDGDGESDVPYRLRGSEASLDRPSALFVDDAEQEHVLAIAHPIDRGGVRRVIRLALGKLDPARGRETCGRHRHVACRRHSDVVAVG